MACSGFEPEVTKGRKVQTNPLGARSRRYRGLVILRKEGHMTSRTVYAELFLHPTQQLDDSFSCLPNAL